MKQELYFVHEKLGESVEGRDVDLITVTDFSGITEEKEKVIEGTML